MERLAHGFQSLKQKTESVTVITRMFHNRALFCPKHVATEQECMSRYLSILRRDIREFVVNSSYRTFFELHANARRREIQLETHASEDAESQ